MKRLAVGAFIAACAVSAPAEAALTDSEQAQIKGFVVEARAERAARVRSLAARPDLDFKEILAPLRAGYIAAPFDETRERFTDALLFGPGSDAARSDLVPAVTAALLARASKRMGDISLKKGGPMTRRETEAAHEVFAIHRFVNDKIANAGNASQGRHDPSAGIRDDAYRSAAEHYHKHLSSHAEWLLKGAPANAEMHRVRIQAALTLVDLASGVVPRHEVSEWLRLAGARRALFERHGALLDDGGSGSERRRERALALIEMAPRAVTGSGLWLIGKASPTGLASGGRIVAARVALGAEAREEGAPRLWAEEVQRRAPDGALAEVALAASWEAVRVALRQSKELRAAAGIAVARAEKAGRLGALAHDLATARLPQLGGAANVLTGVSPEALIAHALRLVLLDARRAIELALVRLAHGRSEPAEQLAVALAVLAQGGDTAVGGRTSVVGTIARQELTAVTHDGAVVSGFKLGESQYTLGRDDHGKWVATIDGKAPVLHELSSVQMRATAGESWVLHGVPLKKAFGSPKASAVDGERFVLVGSSGGFDAVTTGASASNVRVSAVIRSTGLGGGLLVRANPGTTSYTGIALLIMEHPAEAQLVFVDGNAKAVLIHDHVPLPQAGPHGHAVSLMVNEDEIVADIDGRRIEAKLRSPVGPGHVGFAVRSNARLEIRDFDSSVLQ